MQGDLNVSGSSGQDGNAHFYGTASNPLESNLAKIAWDMRVYMNGDNPNNAQVTEVNYNHTCFPAHMIKVQEYTVYEWKPTSDDIGYLATGLVLQLNKIIGDVHPNKQVPCM